MLDANDLRLLAAARLFANIGLESINHLIDDCAACTVARGDKLLEPGVKNEHLYLLLSGELRVYLAGRDMPEHAILTAGDCVGEMSLVDGKPVSALVIAAEDSRLLAIPHDVLWSMVECSHGVARNLLAVLAGRLRNDNLALVMVQARSLEFEQASYVDALTGVHNRHWLLDAYPRSIARCERDGVDASLLITDIDLFKRFNDRLGHLAGDAVLRNVARQLADGLRAQDLVARYGGDEFLILLPNAQADTALLIAERLRNLVASTCSVDTGQGQQSVTLSCGVAVHTRGESLDSLITRADAALREAKSNGRDRVELAAI